MTTILLLRHGQTAWNRDERFRGHADIPLDEVGLAQARAIAQRIASQWKPDVVYAGPLSRTLETARPTAARLNLSVQSEPGLIDVDCGDWQGLPLEEVRGRWPGEYGDYINDPLSFCFPGAESLEAARLRAFERVNEISNDNPGKTIMLVSHTALNRLILLSALGLDSGSFWKIRQDTGAINAMEFRGGEFTVSLMNETSHLLPRSKDRARADVPKTI
jgi:broad specificity phosphatase PhoE